MRDTGDRYNEIVRMREMDIHRRKQGQRQSYTNIE